MIVSCGLNVGKLLKVLNEGLLKEETHLAPLMCLVGNEVDMCSNYTSNILICYFKFIWNKIIRF